MTNREKINCLPPERQKRALACYQKGVHPLYDFINWESWFDSEEPNELNFLNKIKDFTDELGKKYVVLEEDVIIDGSDYMHVFVYGENRHLMLVQNDELYDAINSGTFNQYLDDIENDE